MIETVIEKCKALRLKTTAQNLAQVVEMATNKNWGPLETIDHLFELELEYRYQNKVALRFKQSKLLEKPTIDQFDFDHHGSRKKQKSKILNLMTLEFIRQKKDSILIGNPGVGKSYVAKCIAYAATQAGIKTLFTTATDMINHLIAAEADHSLLKKLHYYCDEIGYLPLGQQGSNLFFQVISQRHQNKSTVLTTNLPFADWGKIFESLSWRDQVIERR